MGWESVMRHFLALSLTPGVLARGMSERSTVAALIARPRCTPRLLAPDCRAVPRAVDVPVITLRADPNQAVTAGAGVQPVAALDHRDSGRRRTGQRAGIAASWLSGTSITAMTHEGPEVLARALALSAATDRSTAKPAAAPPPQDWLSTWIRVRKPADRRGQRLPLPGAGI